MNKHKKLLLILTWALVLPAFALAQMSFWDQRIVYAQDAAANTEETGEIKKSISELEKKLEKEKKEKALLEQNLNKIQGSVAVTQSAINKAQGLIKKAEEEITRKENEIRALEEKNDFQKEMLKNLLKELYYAHRNTGVNVVLAEGDLAKILGSTDALLAIEDRVVDIMEEISDSKEKIAQEQNELAEVKDDHEDLLAEKAEQKQELIADKMEVQQDLVSQEKVIDKLNAELSELQGDLNKILGKAYNAKDIKEAVSFASKSTGVPKGFLYGMLKMETNLGANVGGCTYAQVEDGAQASYKAKKLGARAWNTFLLRRETFKGICKELDLDYRKQKVSCNPKGYVGTGGAMGVAQFMPDTWNGYKKQVSSITGNSPASPWSLTDGVMAMALKLKRTPGVTEGKKSAMKSAACSYLGTCYAPYVNGILYWADNYKDLL